MKYKNKKVGIYQSDLERIAAEALEDNGVWFEYEPYDITFLQGYKSKITSYERWGKKYKSVPSVRKISYRPDFVGENWIMETKGKRTADFNIKWKLFRKYLEDNNIEVTLFMPTNKKQILESIKIIQKLCEVKNQDERQLPKESLPK